MLGKIRTAMACTFMLSLAVQANVPARGSTTTYLDPRFAQVRSSTVSAIVTGDRAADAVQRVGGTVNSDLWVIDAVSATIPTTSARLLAASAGIESVVLNDIVKTSDAGGAKGSRVVNNLLTLPDRQLAPGAALPDGGFVSVMEKGIVTFFDRNGQVTNVVTLPQNKFIITPLVLDDGVVIVSSENKDVYAVSSKNTVKWQIRLNNDTKLLGSIVQGTQDLLYAVDEKGLVYAFDRSSGQLRWTNTATKKGNVLSAPVVDRGGSMYVATDEGEVYAFASNGERLWSTSLGIKFKLSPQLGANNTLLLTSSDDSRLVALSTSSGAPRWSHTTLGKVLSLPVVDSAGRLFFGTDDGYMSALEANGTVLWKVRATTGKFKTSPVLARDERTLFAAQQSDSVLAIDTATGMERWRFPVKGSMDGAPILDSDDGIIVGSDDNDLVRIDAQGRSTYRIKAAGKIKQGAVTNTFGDTIILLDDSKIMSIGRLPEVWDGRPDVQASSDPTAWKVVNPASVDVGSNIVHQATTANGTPLRGAGVTVAVVDSGIFFDKGVRANHDLLLTKMYKGQADFVASECQNATASNMGSCFRSLGDSVDPYGHGTAVSSIIWNNYTDFNTGATLGIAPDANILSVRVLDANGAGTYENVIKGIQYVIDKRQPMNIRVMNLSMSAVADVPYFVDPINRAVERAWASGIVVVAAAGNSGANAETITAPGNDPYVITVGAINTNRTPGLWDDDILPSWSATGPTRDGFAKPDLLASGANVVTFMYKEPTNMARSQKIVQIHPDNSLTSSFFRMNGTSMSSPIVAGIAALMVQANPALTPDQVKYRLMANARLSVTPDGNALTYNTFQQGAGRVWAPDAVLGTATGNGNAGMNISSDLAAGYATDEEMVAHYQGPTQKILSDDGKVWLYYATKNDNSDIWLGFADAATMAWMDSKDVALASTTWDAGRMRWGSNMVWEGGKSIETGSDSYGAGRMSWGTGRMSWGTGRMSWGTGRMSWGTGRMSWGTGRMSWGTGRMSWGTSVAPTSWVVEANN